MRYALAGVITLPLLAGIGVGVYAVYFQAQEAPDVPAFVDAGAKLSTHEEFDKLARENPVKMLDAALTRYQREVRGGAHFTMEIQERVKGNPKAPAAPPVQTIDAWVRGDVPDPPESKKTAIEVMMRWTEGAKSVLFVGTVTRSLFSERPRAEGGLDGEMLTEPAGPLGSVKPNISVARQQSRYCMRDAGLYRSMLRTHQAWKACQEAGEFQFEYLGKKPVEKAGGRECHVIKRLCPRTETDSFELGGTASSDPKAIAAEGFTEVTISIDAERWLQVGSELYRTEPDGARVLVGAYFFRDVELNPTVPPDTFTVAGLKK
jgi:hypothetical protein